MTLAALSRPVTVVVAVMALAGRRASRSVACRSTSFRRVGDPAIYVAQPYGGMDPAQMDGFLTYYYEYHFLYIAGIEHIESKSIQGVALLKLVFHPGTDMNQAMAQVVGYANRARAFMPPGAVPPFITRFDAGQRPDRPARVQQSDAAAGRDAGHRAQPRAAALCHAARRVSAAAVWREPADHRRAARSGSPPGLPRLAGRGDCGGQSRLGR